MKAFADRRFLFITGKGGVGKTTITAALALRLAAQGKRVLIAMCDTKERISTLFETPPIPEEITELRQNIWAVKITAEKAMQEYGLMILKSRTAYKAVFDNRYTRGFFQGVPGLHEWSMLGKAWFHSTELSPSGEPRFDIVLFDAPATGHGLDMLRVPKIITEIVPPGILRRDAAQAWKMFQDPKQSGVVVVTLPEDMPTNETIELLDALTGELKLPIARLVINGVIDELFSEEERTLLLQERKLDRSDPGDEAISGGVRRAIRERVQADSLARLHELDVPMVHLPLLLRDAQRPDAVDELSRLLS